MYAIGVAQAISVVMAMHERVGTVVVGAGIVGIAAAYSLAMRDPRGEVLLIDPLDPMSLTSSKSGENYRNWWPHPVMTAFTDHSIDLMEAIARRTGDRIAMKRRGYALVTRRADPEDLVAELHHGYAESGVDKIRVHRAASSASYEPARSEAWETAPDGVDVLCHQGLIRATFPSFAPDVATVLHIRRAGSVSGQQLGQFMLEAIRERGGRLVRGRLTAVEGTAPFELRVDTAEGTLRVRADRLVNAAGPSLGRVAAMLGEDLGVTCVYQQKIAFEDRAGAIPRDMPFSIDLDGQEIAWTPEERAILATDPAGARLLAPMRGGIHCRPEGPTDGRWIKLGWAYNDTASDPEAPEPADPQFPDIVLRAASRLNPALAGYIGRLPRGAIHYGGYYTMTAENWPLIGPTKTPGSFVAGALSGFGTMAAAATGDLIARWIAGDPMPDYAKKLAPARRDDPRLMAELAAATSKGVL